jgi:beta-glucosidase-like glycosyl hydrolase
MNLVHQIPNIMLTEARAGSNANITGLDLFTPNINIVRDPRWGRGQETPGEDPFLSSQYVYALVRGLQEGEDRRYLKIAVTCKHYVAYDLES